jgi:hypothetical protein
MGKAARARVCQQFTWEVVAERVATLYQAVLAPRQRPVPVPIIPLRPRLTPSPLQISAD